jgi:hypothetical protein
MQHQLDFWPTAQNKPYSQRYWESLSIEEQNERVVLLARLIAKAVCPEFHQNSEEETREP